ncbi:MAG TPA: GNAT family N-acetyltransferase [Cyclobacteriaceae bacterium]|jgi:putative acetyltransferase|nr:GNAT family N-acetyltransferase [Cytophagales bacterium]HMR56826.1 GNAT family N-acetyltransferase [Cyclobacteriaceae bacterium]HNT50570.1 GNAT family N-acetyltransferase [Cyclobacteriaceae bacterium]HRE68763.1 GNAT family N-acetyltransferase [Cyclobacteriaceae bacterium]HRF34155.1 GNAT family N-acetyltransferase [Cyclobacteriaceae bacterium]
MRASFQLTKYTPAHKTQLLEVWEKSVLATHHFLNATDFISIKEIVQSIDFSAFDVYCMMHEKSVCGFIGVADRKIEMLFLSPDYIGQGLGKQLLAFAIENLQAFKVDVNEQNQKAAEFYKKSGFVTYERTNKDDQGYAYPLLRMRLETFESQPI